MEYINGNKYIGNWINDKREGNATILFTNGERFDGEFKDDKRIEGKMKFLNGNIYIGKFNDNLIEGNGIMYYDNGDIYDGKWKNNMKEDYNSKFIYSNKNIFEGEYKNDLKIKGKLVFKNGNLYKGEFKNDNMEGEGIMIYKKLFVLFVFLLFGFSFAKAEFGEYRYSKYMGIQQQMNNRRAAARLIEARRNLVLY